MLKSILSFFFLIFTLNGCVWHKSDKFSFLNAINEYKDNIELYKDESLKIVMQNMYATFPKSKYQFGINTELCFWTNDSENVVIDTVICKHSFNNIDISDSIKIKNNKNFPIMLPWTKERTNKFEIDYFVDNNKIKFKYGDSIYVHLNIHFRIDDKFYIINKNIIKVYHNTSGIVTL